MFELYFCWTNIYSTPCGPVSGSKAWSGSEDYRQTLFVLPQAVAQLGTYGSSYVLISTCGEGAEEAPAGSAAMPPVQTSAVPLTHTPSAWLQHRAGNSVWHDTNTWLDSSRINVHQHKDTRKWLGLEFYSIKSFPSQLEGSFMLL